MYYFVDPISITPFSSKAVDKYLPLYLATVIRHRFANLQNNRTDANNIIDNNIVNKRQIIQDIVDYFYNRESNTQKYSNTIMDIELQEKIRNIFTNEMKIYIERFVNDAFEQWVNLANGNDLWYYNDNPRQSHDNVLFTETEDYDDTRSDSYWTVPNSLRIVEQEAVLKIENLY